MDSAAKPPETPRLLPQVRAAMQLRRLAPRTQQAYLDWILRFIRHHDTRHPNTMGETEVLGFLNWLVADRRVAHSTQMQALSALLFLYGDVLRTPLGDLRGLLRARAPARLPVVLTAEEVRAVLSHLRGTAWLVATLLYGSGLRLMESLTLRVKDLDFSQREILVRRAKGGKDRVTMLPESLKAPLERQLARVRALHQRDLAAGGGMVWLPDAMERKVPAAAKGWAWQWVFPAKRRYVDAETGAPPPTSYPSVTGAAGGGRCGTPVRHRETGELSHLSTLVRDPSAGRWL